MSQQTVGTAERVREGVRDGVAAHDQSARATWHAIIELCKPGITRLVTITAGVGFVIGAAARSWNTPELVLTALATLIGVALTAAGANALNQWMEREPDAIMPRTANRPIPEGRLTPDFALLVGVGLCCVGMLVLFPLGVMTFAICLGTILVYLLLYTPMKRMTVANTLVGAVPGALPPLIGFTAASAQGWGDAGGTVGVPGGWSLFMILFVWQIPHFLAIAWMYRKDYAVGGYRMLPIVDRSGHVTALMVVAYAVLLLMVSLAPVLVLPGLLGWVYGVVAFVSGVLFLIVCSKLVFKRTDRSARRVFLGSIIHLPVLLMAMVVDVAIGLVV